VAHQRPEEKLARQTAADREEIATLTVQLRAAQRRIGCAEANGNEFNSHRAEAIARFD
jgi:hypothetical protein